MFGGVKPFDKKKDFQDDLLKPFQFFDPEDLKKYSIHDTALTYIKKDYEKYLDPVIISEPKQPVNDVEMKLINTLSKEDNDDDDDIIKERKSAYFIAKVKNHLMALSDDRAIEYND